MGKQGGRAGIRKVLVSIKCFLETLIFNLLNSFCQLNDLKLTVFVNTSTSQMISFIENRMISKYVSFCMSISYKAAMDIPDFLIDGVLILFLLEYDLFRPK